MQEEWENAFNAIKGFKVFEIEFLKIGGFLEPAADAAIYKMSKIQCGIKRMFL